MKTSGGAKKIATGNRIKSWRAKI